MAVIPTTAFIGVRRSWDITDKNLVFVLFAVCISFMLLLRSFCIKSIAKPSNRKSVRSAPPAIKTTVQSELLSKALSGIYPTKR